MVKGEIIFFKRFSNFNFRKKKKKKRWKKEEKTQFVFNYHILFHKPNNPTYHLFFVRDKEISDMILIITSTISFKW